MATAQFTFHGSLNDFLPQAKKNSGISYFFSNAPAIKDAIEAIGIPHPEIKEIFVNNRAVTFKYLLSAGDSVEVYPFIQIHPSPQKFVLDVHLGKLARLLRLLGFDTLYQNDFSDKEIIAFAREQERIVLTRDVGLLKHKIIQCGYWLRSQLSPEQAKEVIRRFALAGSIRPFSRCLVCNGLLEPVAKERVLDQLPANTIMYFTDFYQCTNCKQVYWKGSHYEKMIQTVKAMVH